MDVAAASWINESPLPRSTDGDYAFSRLTPIQSYANFTISAPVNASRLTINCEAVSATSKTFTLVEKGDNIYTASCSATDRGCSIDRDIAANADSSASLDASLISDCPEGAGRARISFFYGSLSSSGRLESPNLISCIPSFWSANGNLTVVTTNSSFSDRVVETPRFNAEAHDIKELGITAQQFEDGVMTVRTFNPATSSAGNTNAPVRLAEFIVRSIRITSKAFSAQNIIDAAQRIYPAIYTMLAITYFYPELGTPVQMSGTIPVAENRLHVVPPVAIAIIVIFAILSCSTGYLILYLWSHPSILAEEPVGLFGAANLLSGSNVYDVIERYHRRGIFYGFPSGNLSKEQKMDIDNELKETEYWVEPGSGQHALLIKMDAPRNVRDSRKGMIQ